MIKENDRKLMGAILSNGKSKRPDDFNLLEAFYSNYGKFPNVLSFDNTIGDFEYYDWDKITEKINEHYPNNNILYTEKGFCIKKEKPFNKQQSIILEDGLFLHMEGSLNSESGLDETYEAEKDGNCMTYHMVLHNDELPEADYKKLSDIFKESLIKKAFSLSIGMVSYDNGHFFVRDFDIKDKLNELSELDLHYGEGFNSFHNELLDRLVQHKKGLTLFHGDAGTGKSTYIRYLIRTIKEMDQDNDILYYPPTMVASITEPTFIDFIANWAKSVKGNKYLLIEDAEPLLESRENVRNISVTNLLNATDGLLSDILGIQIIATFNTDLNDIDSALLRPERLQARKNFKKLKKENAIELAKKIGMDESSITEDMTLAEIYSMKKDTKPLLHDIESEQRKISF